MAQLNTKQCESLDICIGFANDKNNQKFTFPVLNDQNDLEAYGIRNVCIDLNRMLKTDARNKSNNVSKDKAIKAVCSDASLTKSEKADKIAKIMNVAIISAEEPDEE